jgi:phosphoribosyl-ATP pyrophosphohydrolase/phosphoribosyl-AMP cyclohydrolase
MLIPLLALPSAMTPETEAFAASFALAGRVFVDAPAALALGSDDEQASWLRSYVRRAACRIGGGLRDAASAVRWLDAGAEGVVLDGETPEEVLAKVPEARRFAALTATPEGLCTGGFGAARGASLVSHLEAISPSFRGVFVTFVGQDGALAVPPVELVRELARRRGKSELSVGGAIPDAALVAELDRAGARSVLRQTQLGGALTFADALTAPLVTDRPDGLFSTVVCDEHGVALGLAYSSRESLRVAIERGVGAYFSRSRGGLWVKGETSGALQKLLRVELDCDRDALRFLLEQAEPGFCHEATRTCWGEDHGVPKLARVLAARRLSAPAGSYTKRLFDDGALLESKLLEEAGELASATTSEDIAWETADVIYFALVFAARAGVPLSAVTAELDRRSLGVTRRKGDAKPKKETR